MSGTLHENLSALMKIFRRIISQIKKVPHKTCGRTQKHALQFKYIVLPFARKVRNFGKDDRI